MLIVHVFVHVKPAFIDVFREQSVQNARKSIQEPGILRFDLLQQQDDPERFVLVEIYQTPEDAAKHKETAHYKKWRDAVANMMAEPRKSIKYTSIFPAEAPHAL